MSFTAKQLRVTLILAGANSVFPGTNSNTLIIERLRVSAKVQAVARLATQCELRVYGMRQQDMNALTVCWANPPVILDHIVILEANNTGKSDGWVQVFKGTIVEAQPLYNAQPDVPFSITAVTGYWVKINPVAPSSYPGQTDIGGVAGDIVERMGAPWTLAVADGANDVILSSPYLCGTLWDQLAQACQAANCDYYIQGDEVLITPNGLPRSDVPAVVLSPVSGLIGYPQFERSGLNVSAYYDPAFQCGTALDINSAVPNASGRWFPYAMAHDLEANMPGGRWFTNLQCLRVLVG